MFTEAFSLKQVYISPRAYYEEKKEINSHEDDNLRELQERQSQKVVFDLEQLNTIKCVIQKFQQYN